MCMMKMIIIWMSLEASEIESGQPFSFDEEEWRKGSMAGQSFTDDDVNKYWNRFTDENINKDWNAKGFKGMECRSIFSRFSQD